MNESDVFYSLRYNYLGEIVTDVLSNISCSNNVDMLKHASRSVLARKAREAARALLCYADSLELVNKVVPYEH